MTISKKAIANLERAADARARRKKRIRVSTFDLNAAGNNFSTMLEMMLRRQGEKEWDRRCYPIPSEREGIPYGNYTRDWILEPL